MLIGSSQVNITPDVPFELQGSSIHVTGKEILDPLYASCVVLENKENVLAVIGCDLLWVPDDAIGEIRSRVEAGTGIKPANIIISATHTHNGPRMADEDIPSGKKRDQETYEKVITGITMSAIKAYENRKPGKMGYGKSTVERCGHNRRYIMSDGRSKMNPQNGYDPDRLMVEGPVDKEVQVVWFEDMEGNLEAVMVNFASHPVTTIKMEYGSADFPGAMRRDIQTFLGDDVPVLYLQGACGNVSPRDVESQRLWGKGLDGYRRVGRILAAEVIKMISSDFAEEKTNPLLEVHTRELMIPYRDLSPEEADRVRSRWENVSDEKREALTFHEKMYSRSIMRLAALKEKGELQRVEISAFVIDDIIFVTVPCEYFVEYQLELKKKYCNNKIVVLEMTNGVGPEGYVPTRLAIALGGYETYNRRLCDDAGDMILKGWMDMIDGIVLDKLETGRQL